MHDQRYTDYSLLNEQLLALNEGENDVLAISANSVALMFDGSSDINWCGIYVLRGDELVLGPFQGKPACVRIPLGSGVCGAAASSRQTLRVADVNSFDGHIACDVNSRSELVVPLALDEVVLGVLDIDSPYENRFSREDQFGVETLCRTLVECVRNAGGAFI